MSRFVDAIIAYRILRKLATPFSETNAFKLGIIDEKGKILRKFNELTTPEEKDSYTLLDRLVWRIKRIIERVPYASPQLASFAAALALIKEHHELGVEPMASNFESRFLTISEDVDLSAELEIVERYFAGSLVGFKVYSEEMAVGGGFSGQATANANPNLAGRDILLGKKIQRRKKPNV